jgi:uncharacterized protein with HEPN domain
VADYTFSEYEQNLMLRSAAERQFEIIGEALHQAEVDDPEVTDLLPELHRIVGMRNRIIHGYDIVDDELLWQTIQHNIPPFEDPIFPGIFEQEKQSCIRGELSGGEFDDIDHFRILFSEGAS